MTPAQSDMSESRRAGRREEPSYDRVWRAYENNLEAYLRTKEELDEVVARLQRRDQELAAERQHAKIQEEQLQSLRAKLTERDNTLRSEQERRIAAEDLLAKRSAELDAANALLPAPESVTEAYIIELVQELNYEVAQAATTLSETYKGLPRVKPSRSVLASLYPDVVGYIEECGAARILYQRTSVDPTTALQIGLQATLIDIARILLSSETFSDFAGFDSVLRAMKQGGE